MHIGIVFAMEMECAPWRDRHAFRATTEGAPTASASEGRIVAWDAAIARARVRLVICDVLAPRAAASIAAACGGASHATAADAAAHHAANQRQPLREARLASAAHAEATIGEDACPPRADVLIVAGYGGGLRPAYRAGDILAARHVAHTLPDATRADARAARALARETTASVDGTWRDNATLRRNATSSAAAALPDDSLHSDARLLTLAADCGATIVESLVTVDRVADTVEEKSRLGIEHDVVDMETARLFVEARKLGVPALAVRVIGDPVEEPVPFEVMRAMGPDQRVRPGRFAFEVARRPWRWPTIVRAFRTHDRARHRLADFLDRLILALDRQANDAPSPATMRAG